MNDIFQYYPTPRKLAQFAWSKFVDRDFDRVLEPSAGQGALIDCAPDYRSSYRNTPNYRIDVCEINMEHHPALRERQCTIIANDFMTVESASIYSHIIMNPPFAYGVDHVLKAWELLWDGEIVAIINAESLMNLCNAKRVHLASLVESFGSVDFVENAFSGNDSIRRTSVTGAVIHLVKKADPALIFKDIIADLKHERTERLEEAATDLNHPVIPGSWIDNQILVFEAAVRTTRDSVTAAAQAEHYAGLLGKTVAETQEAKPKQSVASSRSRLADRYDELKERAWNSVINSLDVQSRISSGVRGQIRREFETIKQLEFTKPNILGFLNGLAQNQGSIQIAMMIDIFDRISRYGIDNTYFYRGWKSNDKHRTLGRKIKPTRFIIPNHSDYLSSDTQSLCDDLDKVFALLDGKTSAERSLSSVINEKGTLRFPAGRHEATYFDIRYYQKARTVHFYPKRPDLIERLNLRVGRHRQWIPRPEDSSAKNFWPQYHASDKCDKAIRSLVSNIDTVGHYSRNGLVYANYIEANQDVEGGPEFMQALDALFQKAHKAAGLPTDFHLLGHSHNQRALA